MGLDMYLYKISKNELPELKEKYGKEESNEISQKYSILEDVPEFLKEYAVDTILTRGYYNLKKINSEYKDIFHLSGFSFENGKNIVSFRGENGNTLELSSQQLEEKYIELKEEKVFVINKKEVAYWRKANMIREWFVKHIDDFSPDDNCEYYLCDEYLLHNLLEDCYSVKNNHELAESLIPTEGGFFFGSTEYDEWYFEEIENTIEMIEEILKDTNFENDVIFYTEWW